MQLSSDMDPGAPAAPIRVTEPAPDMAALADHPAMRPASRDGVELDRQLAGIRPQIYRFVLARLLDAHLAEDVTQDVLVTLLATRARCDQAGSSLVGWAFGIAARKVSETQRTLRRRHEDVIDALPDRPTGGPLDNPEMAAVRLDTTRQLARLLAGLPGLQGDIVRLRVAAGLTAEETAAALGLTAGAVRVAQHRALARLREMLRSDAPDRGEVTS